MKNNMGDEGPRDNTNNGVTMRRKRGEKKEKR